MDRFNHLQKIKEYEKQLKQKCKIHRQVNYGYTSTSNPVKKQIAKTLVENKIIDISQNRVTDPYMHSIQIAQNRQLNNYVFKNLDIFLDIKDETQEQSIQELTPELLADGWRIIQDNQTKNYIYINILKGSWQNEYPTITHLGKQQISAYTSRGQTYYVNDATGDVTRTIPQGYTEDDIITSDINEPIESQRFLKYYKPKFNTRVRGDRVMPDSGIRDALINDINKIYSHPTIYNFFKDYRYLLNKDILESSSRKELIKQYKSILNILAHHDSEIPTTFHPFSSITEEFNKARREKTTINVDQNDEIEQSTQSTSDPVEPDRYDYTRYRQEIKQILEDGVNKDGTPLTQEEIDILNERLETITQHTSYTDMLIMLKDDLEAGVSSDGVTPLTQEQIDLFKQRIAETEERLRNINQQLETIPDDPTDLTETPEPTTEPESTAETTEEQTSTTAPTLIRDTQVLNNLLIQREKYRNMLDSNTDESGAKLTREQVNRIRVALTYLNQHIHQQQAVIRDQNVTPATAPTAPTEQTEQTDILDEIDKLPTNTTNTTDIAYDPDGRELAEDSTKNP